MNTKYKFDAVIFDLDGVVTQTALVHSVAWKEMFDNYLREREEKYGEPFREFTHEDDYLTFVDGKPRYEGVKSFLESRGIQIPFGNPADDISIESCCGIGNRKNIAFNDILKRDGVKVYPSTVELMHQLKAEGIHIGVASSSKNCESVLRAANLLDLIETRVDGVVSAELGLSGKPEPDIFTTAADNLGVTYDRAVVVEDAISGVQAGKKGNFGLVLGLAREDNTNSLLNNGADVVVEDMEDFGFDGIVEWFDKGLEEDNWSITYRDYDVEKERSREALLSVGNGYFGTRGAMEEVGQNEVNYPGTYMAGVYNRLTSKVAGKDIENEDFVNVINWLPITFKIDDGQWFDINNTNIISIERKVDFITGVFYKIMIVEDPEGRQTQVYTRRFASMDNPNLAGIHYCLQPINYSGTLYYKSSLLGNHINNGVKRYADLNQQHLTAVAENGRDNFQELIVKTTQSGIYINAISNLSVLYNGENLEVDFSHSHDKGIIESMFSKELKQGEYLGLMKLVYLKNSNELIEISSNPAENFTEDFDTELQKSHYQWEKIWHKIDIRLEGDRLSQKMLRLHLYHLMSGTSPHNEHIDFGIPARGLTGEAYRGHIFWDELYILPFYNIHYPDVTKSVLMYRYRRLDEARKYAKEFGYKGAMFPWQSGSNGREETQKFHYNPISGQWGDDSSSLQRHVSLAIGYNIIQYFDFTGDADFMINYGIEMLLEISRFWESKCQMDSHKGRYSIDKVMGPDEFHEAYPNSETDGLKDNAYTNIMTVWLLDNTIRIVEMIDRERLISLFKKLNFQPCEFDTWKVINKKMNVEISENGIISQFYGYFDLKELDWDFYKEKYGNIHRMDRVLKAEGKSPDEFKVAKQADTLMLFYNLNKQSVTDILSHLGYVMPKDYINNNLEYYLQRTSHGSTLSRVVHSYLAKQIGRNDLSWSMFQEAITSDYKDIQGGTTAEGIHTGVMAGTIWITIAAFAGIEFDNNTVSIDPKLPNLWRKLEFNFDFRNVNYHIIMSQSNLSIQSSDEVTLMIRNKKAILKAGKLLTISLKP